MKSNGNVSNISQVMCFCWISIQVNVISKVLEVICVYRQCISIQRHKTRDVWQSCWPQSWGAIFPAEVWEFSEFQNLKFTGREVWFLEWSLLPHRKPRGRGGKSGGGGVTFSPSFQLIRCRFCTFPQTPRFDCDIGEKACSLSTSRSVLSTSQLTGQTVSSPGLKHGVWIISTWLTCLLLLSFSIIHQT